MSDYTGVDVSTLVMEAINASQRAYAPYSQYVVGAALLSRAGTVYRGCNVESAAYPAGICAERTALVKAISEGEREFDTLAVVTRDGGSPCGLCRQMLYEFAPDLRVIIADLRGSIHHDLPLHDLLPLGFGPANLDGTAR
jgi:cytidine deaminase